MNRLVIKSTLSAAALAMSLGTIVTAKAEQIDETFIQESALPTKTITFSRAELSSEDGRASVERQVRKAAEQVCGVTSYREAGSLSSYLERKECYKQAMAQAMSQVNSDQIASTTR